MTDFLTRKLKEEEERLLNLMKSFDVGTHHDDTSLQFGNAHNHGDGRQMANATKIDKDKLTSSMKTLDNNEIGKDALIIDLQDAVQRQEAELARLRKENDDLTFIESKYTTFRKTVAYYCTMMHDIASSLPTQVENSSPQKKSSLHNSIPPKFLEQQHYLVNLISGLKTFIAMYDKEHNEIDEIQVKQSLTSRLDGANMAADMMTASMSIADTLRSHNIKKSLKMTTKPMLFSFVPLPYKSELDAAIVFRLFLFAETTLVDANEHQEIMGVNFNTNNNMNLLPSQEDPTADQWFGRKAFITMLFVADIFDERLSLERAAAAFDAAAQISERGHRKFSNRIQYNEFVQVLSLLAKCKFVDSETWSDTQRAHRVLQILIDKLRGFDSEAGRDELLCNLKVFYPMSNQFVFAKLCEHQQMLYNRYLRCRNYGILQAAPPTLLDDQMTVTATTHTQGSHRQSVNESIANIQLATDQYLLAQTPSSALKANIVNANASTLGSCYFPTDSPNARIFFSPSRAALGIPSKTTVGNLFNTHHSSNASLDIPSSCSQSIASMSSATFNNNTRITMSHETPTPRVNKAAALRRASAIGAFASPAKVEPFAMGSAARFGIHTTPVSNKSTPKQAFNSPDDSLSPTKHKSPSTGLRLVEKQNNGFEYFCREYGIVPDLVNEAFPRRISQFMRFFNDSRFPYFFGCLLYLAVTISDKDMGTDFTTTESHQRDWHKVASGIELIATQVFTKSIGQQ